MRLVAAALCTLVIGWVTFQNTRLGSSAVGAASRHDATIPPRFVDIRDGYQPSDVQLLDRHGVVLHELRVDASRRRLGWTALDDISPALPAAVIAAEDRRFHQHHGVDVVALVAAAMRRLSGGPLRGASTISMQVAALLDPQLRRREGARTVTDKWRQMRLAWNLERTWSKSQILEAYLNLVTFRGEIQGVAAAARILFAKAPHGLSEAEATVLTVLLKSPNATAGAARQRADRLQKVLHAAGGSTANAADIAQAVHRAAAAPSGTGAWATLAPHVARRLLRTTAPFVAVQSTLDADIQQAATQTLHQQLLALRDRNVHDGAILVVDNASGDVVAYVGGSGELSRAPYVDGIRALRQAGSALKPFLYALALEQHLLTPASLLEDWPLEIPVTGGLYRPQNYDEQFHGLVSMRTALAGSLNVPAVRTLQLVGVDAFVRHLRQLGLSSLVESGDHYGPALALGAGDISLWALVNAYRTLANAGGWSPLRMQFDDPASGAGTRIYSAATAFLVSNVLADRDSRSITFGLESPLGTTFWTAVKTGTSKDMRDNWCVGYSARYTVGVWVGNFSGRPMRDVSGVTGAAPVWLELMTRLHRTLPSAAPRTPAGVVAAVVESPQGETARTEWFLDGTQPLQRRITLAGPRSRITHPVDGTVVAIDPDIPVGQQRMVFDADGAPAQSRWVLDGADLGSINAPAMWAPRPGRHQLGLVSNGRVVDMITFVVRGAAADDQPATRTADS